MGTLLGQHYTVSKAQHAACRTQLPHCSLRSLRGYKYDTLYVSAGMATRTVPVPPSPYPWSRGASSRVDLTTSHSLSAHSCRALQHRYAPHSCFTRTMQGSCLHGHTQPVSDSLRVSLCVSGPMQDATTCAATTSPTPFSATVYYVPMHPLPPSPPPRPPPGPTRPPRCVRYPTCLTHRPLSGVRAILLQPM